jgi:hypothetical protein
MIVDGMSRKSEPNTDSTPKPGADDDQTAA